MTKSTFKWLFGANEIKNLNNFTMFESPHFVSGSKNEFEWVIVFSNTTVDGYLLINLELQLVKSSNFENIDVTYDLSLVEFISIHQRQLFSKKGCHSFDARTKESLKCTNVFPWGFLKTLSKEHKFTFLCNLKLNNYCDDAMLIIPQKNDLLDFEKIFNNPKLSDFTLRTKNCEFKVHKLILMARSPVFAAMFESDMKENQENFAEITDVEDDVLKELLRYMYCGKVQNISLYAYELFKAANKYQLENLQDLSLQTLLQNLSIDNVVDLYSLADHYSNETLKNTALMYMKNNLKMIIDKSGFENSSNKMLVDVLRFISPYLE